MKKIYTTLVAVIAIAQFSFAQWSIGTNIHNTNSGNVSIGNNAANTLLTLGNDGGNGTTDVQRYLTITNGSSTSPASGNGVGISFNVGNNFNPTSTLGAVDVVNEYYNQVSNMRFYTVTGSSLTEKMRIDGSGNVGIGTTSPAFKLDVNGVINTSYYMSNAQGVYVDGATGMGMNNNSGSLAFRTNNIDNRMVIAASGRVGIGTSIPDEKLTVKGKIHAEEVRIDLSIPYPDYVFKPSYYLRPLYEVKDFIGKYHHLPDMPTEATVTKDGLNLGEINTLLLKKVEELTLYLIEKDEQLKAQEARLKRIEATLKILTPNK